ncbi:hypothetical protein D2L64_13920 [Micromonospora radicis]|uniref:Uncharacterized protein n=1 Tax=Micromonospora radicis TaxID=1894971 RepID=A0A418MUW8_9ACTN|nr:hypothetical protein D2L64_13920 [Micromonospora radicis]
MIDLDEPGRPPESPAGTGPGGARKAVWRFAAVFVVGALLGGIGVDALHDYRAQRAQDAVVALVALPDSANYGGSSDGRRVQLSGRLTVVNAGPAPVTIHEVQAQRPDVTVRSPRQQPRLLSPGETAHLLVEVGLDCTVWGPLGPLPVRLSVQTRDGQVREFSYPVALPTSYWERDGLGMCPQPSPPR